jgi:membrane protease YdiL (CAAX protease family)
VGFGAAIFAVYFVTQSIVAVIFAIGKLINTAANDVTQAVSALATNGLLISMATIVSAIVGVGFIVLFIKIRHGPGIAEYLGLKSVRGKTFLALIGVIVVLLAVSALLDRFSNSPKDTGFTIDAYNTSRWPVLFGFAVVVFAPLFEELFFRGFIFVGLQASKIGVVGAIILTSLAWALLHLQYDPAGMATIFVLGIVFGIVRWKTNSLWSTLFLHAVWNLMALVATVIAVST